MRDEFDQVQRQLLLRHARRSIEFETRREHASNGQPPDGLRISRGAFVTLRSDGELRGCIGHTSNSTPLWASVRDAAIGAASRDPRFDPVRPDELAGIRIEISVLGAGASDDTPFIPVSDVSEIVIGVHGVKLVSLSGHTGLLLPHVPVERGWDRDQLLNILCRKAGVPPDAYRARECRLYRFTAESFSEDIGFSRDSTSVE